MIGAQFAISAFMLALVAIVFMFRTKRVKESSYEFPRSEIYTLEQAERGQHHANDWRRLRHELEALPNVDGVAYSRARFLTSRTTQRPTVSLRAGRRSREVQPAVS